MLARYMFGRHKKGAPLEMRRKGSFMLLIYLLATLVGSFLAPQTAQALPTLALPNTGIVSNDLNQLYYNSLIFSGPNVVKEGDSLTKLGGNFSYAPGVVYYVYIDPTDKGKTDAYLMAVNSKSNPTKGQYVKLRFDTKTKTYSDVKDIHSDITLAKGEIPTVRNCNIPWIGWIVCPIANALATALDDLYNIVTDILVISPIDTTKQFASGHDKPIYAIWSIIRGISNIVFVILFIIVILSYVTGFGLSNYTIKKIFPRLIVTAILVNLSLTICVFLIDVFNLLGHSVSEILLKIQRTTMPESDLTAISAITWAKLLASVYGAGSLALALNGGIIGATLLVLGGMAGALATIVAVVIALSARQALVIILTVVSPLAFVLNLLPNTEKWFEKWWKTFTKILAIFPVFSLIYGASQLASSIIMQTANDSFILILVGLIVKVIPFGLLITIIKSSDAIMDRITNAATNRTRSLGEGAQEYLHRKHEIQKARYETGESKTPLGRFTPRGMARSFYQGRRRDEARLRTAKARQEAFYTQRSSKLDSNQRPANVDALEEMTARSAEAMASANKQQVDVAFSTIRAKVDRDMFQAKVDKVTGEVILDQDNKPVLEFRGIGHFTNPIEYEVAQASLRQQIAEKEAHATSKMQQDFQTKRVISNVELPVELGYKVDTKIRSALSGINTEYDKYVLADVITAQRKEWETEIDLQYAFAQQINLKEADALSFAIGVDKMKSNINKRLDDNDGAIEVTGKDGQKYTLDRNNKALRFAMAKLVGQAPRDDIHEFIQEATADLFDDDGNIIQNGPLDTYREEIVDLMLSKVGSNKLMGIKVPDWIRRGVFRGRDSYYEINAENIANGRYSASYIAGASKDLLNTMIEGMDKMLKNEEITLAELDENTNEIRKANLLDNYLNKYFYDKDKGIIDYAGAQKSLESFRDSMQDALDNPQTGHLIQKQQRDRIETLIVQVDDIIGKHSVFKPSPKPKAKTKPKPKK